MGQASSFKAGYFISNPFNAPARALAITYSLYQFWSAGTTVQGTTLQLSKTSCYIFMYRSQSFDSSKSFLLYFHAF